MSQNDGEFDRRQEPKQLEQLHVRFSNGMQVDVSVPCIKDAVREIVAPLYELDARQSSRQGDVDALASRVGAVNKTLETAASGAVTKEK